MIGVLAQWSEQQRTRAMNSGNIRSRAGMMRTIYVSGLFHVRFPLRKPKTRPKPGMTHLKSLATDNNASVIKLCESIRTLQEGNQTQVRALCKQWGVENSVQGKRRGMGEIKAELCEKLQERGAQYMNVPLVAIRAKTDGNPQGGAE